MNHLTEKDYISFVSAAAYNESFVTLAKRIAEHIRQCDDCREQLEAYQTISDALTGSTHPSVSQFPAGPCAIIGAVSSTAWRLDGASRPPPRC